MIADPQCVQDCPTAWEPLSQYFLYTIYWRTCFWFKISTSRGYASMCNLTAEKYQIPVLSDICLLCRIHPSSRMSVHSSSIEQNPIPVGWPPTETADPAVSHCFPIRHHHSQLQLALVFCQNPVIDLAVTKEQCDTARCDPGFLTLFSQYIDGVLRAFDFIIIMIVKKDFQISTCWYKAFGNEDQIDNDLCIKNKQTSLCLCVYLVQMQQILAPGPPPGLHEDSPAWSDNISASALDIRRRIFCNRSLNMAHIKVSRKKYSYWHTGLGEPLRLMNVHSA